MTQKEYGKRISQMARPSPIVKDCIFAYVIGGLICVLGQILWNYYGSLGLEKTDASTAASMTLVALSALVPITGFANAVSAAAVEFKTEGYILGVGAKMFTIAGPVMVYGTTASVIYGLVYWIWMLIG